MVWEPLAEWHGLILTLNYHPSPLIIYKLLLGGIVIRMSDPLIHKLVLAHGGDLNGNNLIIQQTHKIVKKK